MEKPFQSDYWTPGAKYQLYLAKITSILSEEKRTVRDIYYALESRGFEQELAQHGLEFEYKYVKRAVKKGRRAGFINPSLIVDASRAAATRMDPGYVSHTTFLEEQVEQMWQQYNENFWDEQRYYVEVWLEKQSLASVFKPICNELNVRLEATRGDWSDSKIFQACQRLLDKLGDGKDIRILYFGDFNPSGLHAPVAIQNTMAHYGIPVREDIEEDDSTYFDIWPMNGPMKYDMKSGATGTLRMERIALNLEHVKKFDLPENPSPSKTDKDRELRNRFMKHASNGRDVNIELNALKEYHRDYLEQRISDSIMDYIDTDKRQRTKNRVEKRREQLKQAINVDYSKVE